MEGREVARSNIRHDSYLVVVILLILTLCRLIPTQGTISETSTYYAGEIYFEEFTLKIEITMKESTVNNFRVTETSMSFNKHFQTLKLSDVTLSNANYKGSSTMKSWTNLDTGDSYRDEYTSAITLSGDYETNDHIEMTTSIDVTLTYSSETITDNRIEYVFDCAASVSITGEGIQTSSDSKSYEDRTSWIEAHQISTDESCKCANGKIYETYKVEVTHGGWDWDYDISGTGNAYIVESTKTGSDLIWITTETDQMVKTEDYDDEGNLIARYSLGDPDAELKQTLLTGAVVMVFLGAGFTGLIMLNRWQKKRDRLAKERLASTLPSSHYGETVTCPHCFMVVLDAAYCERCGAKLK